MRNLAIQLTHDAPSFAGMEAAIAKVAALAGLEASASADLATATREACDAAFALARQGAPIQVSVRLLDDKVEIEVAHEGEPDPAAGLDTFLGAGGSGAAWLGRVDGIQYSAANGVSRTTLTKKRPATRA